MTPDSFSDGGRYLDATAAVAHGRRLIDEGADIVDVGGESSRPGAEPVDEAEELRRVVPVIEALARQVRVSIDTVKPAVARAAGGGGRHAGQRRVGLAGRGGRRARGRLRRHAPPGHAQDDAARTPLRRRGGRGQAPSWPSGRSPADAARHRRGVGRSRHRVRQDLGPQPEPCCATSTSSSTWAGRCWWAPAARASWAAGGPSDAGPARRLAADAGRSRPPRWTTGSRPRWPPPPGPWPRAPAWSGCTMSVQPSKQRKSWQHEPRGNEGQVGPGHPPPELPLDHQGPDRRCASARAATAPTIAASGARRRSSGSASRGSGA